MPTKSKSKRKMQPLSKDPSADNLVARLDDIRNHAVCTTVVTTSRFHNAFEFVRHGAAA